MDMIEELPDAALSPFSAKSCKIGESALEKYRWIKLD
jgi:hypothetical protein